MKELEVSGIIKQSRNTIEILNEAELAKISKNG
jgi:CRP/FNR family transcriptional regulator